MSLTGLEGPLLAGVSLAADCSESQEKRSHFLCPFSRNAGRFRRADISTGSYWEGQHERNPKDNGWGRPVTQYSGTANEICSLQRKLSGWYDNQHLCVGECWGGQVCRNIPEPGGASLYTSQTFPNQGGNYEEDGKKSSGLTLHRLRFQTRKNLALRVLIDRVTNFASQQIVHYP